MNPEQARELRDSLRPRPAGLALRPGSQQTHTVRFDKTWPEQAGQALTLLSGIERLEVAPGNNTHSISISYRVTDYTLHGIEAALIHQGFHLDNCLFCRFSRSLVYFSEETELRNLSVPERLIKKTNEVYMKAWEHHPHGDHDETPLELREER